MSRKSGSRFCEKDTEAQGCFFSHPLSAVEVKDLLGSIDGEVQAIA
jgi:hypothetical protein